ncbi:MAG: ATP-binding protein [Deltaproteobacteria bacterium]|nr:ATP-binding protein [Deltaproteobacteria bacterium]
MTKDGLPELPLGWQGFEKLRLDKAVYIDKTRYLPMVRGAGRFVFCARPRRFGKSLTVSALDAFYSGRTELFRGLAVEKDMDSPGFVTRPVIRLDMKCVAGSRSIEILEKNFFECLGNIAKRHKVSLRGADSARAFLYLMKDVHETTGKTVVVLIDEYDAPVISIIQKEESAIRDLLGVTRDVMSEFYSQIKSADEDIESVFITGVTKFSRMGVFSSLNNLIDVSIEPEFGTFMGYTQEELETNFMPFIAEGAHKLKMSEEILLTKIRDYYDGFSFDGESRLYNPFSVLLFFKTYKFLNYWMVSGSNSLIRKFLKDKAITVDQFQGMTVGEDFASDPGEIDATPPEGFMYQSGYLTLRTASDNAYSLDYPNREVRSAISKLFLENLALASSWAGISTAGRELNLCLATADVPGMVDVLVRLFAGICYDDHLLANRDPKRGFLTDIIRKAGLILSFGKRRKLTESLAELLRKTMGEGFYRSVLHASLCMAGAKVIPETHVGLGRIDLLAECGIFTYVIELKMAKDANGGAKSAMVGISQIHERGYARAFKDPILVSVAIGRKERNIVACRFERDGQGKDVEIKDPGRPSVVSEIGKHE